MDEYKQRLVKGFELLQDMLQEYYVDNALFIVYDFENLQAFVYSRAASKENMSVLFADERFDCMVESALDKINLQMHWEDSNSFWLVNV